MSASGPVPRWKTNDAITARAAEFFERRRFEDWSDAEQAGLEAWLAESALHRVAWLRLEGAAARSEELFALDALDLKRAGKTASGVHRRFMLPLLAAASVVLFAALGISLVNSLMRPPPDRSDQTDVGGRTLLSFADHTQIELNTDTAIRFRMTSAERIVWLEKGEAWFHVSHDAARPFTVYAGKHRVTDLGTEFLIRRDADAVHVALLNGKAALSAEGVQTATLTPGEEAFATPVSLSVIRKTPQELASELAWRQGMLVFHNTPLAEVVREFNRYNTVKLMIADPSIANQTISADIKTDDYESFLELAENVLKLRVAREGSVILISRATKNSGRHAP